MKLKKISKNQIWHVKKWNQKQMMNYYLNSLSWKFMQIMIDHFLEQHSTQFQQQLWQLLAFSILIFQLESLSASQLVSVQISIAAISQLQCLSHSSSSLQPSNRLESESSRYQICCMIKTVKTLWHEWTVDLWDRLFIDRLDQQWDSQ